MNAVIDMDIDSPSSQGLYDHDERFRIPTPPPPPPPPLPPPLVLPPLPPTNEPIFTAPLVSFFLSHTSSNETNTIYNDQNSIEQYQQKDHVLSNLSSKIKTESTIPSGEPVFRACLGQFESSSSSEESPANDNDLPIRNDDTSLEHQQQQQENILLPVCQNSSINTESDSNRSRDEFVRLLTKEAYISKSSSPVKSSHNRHRIFDYQHPRRHQRRLENNDDDDDSKKKKPSSSRVKSNRLHPRSSITENR